MSEITRSKCCFRAKTRFNCFMKHSRMRESTCLCALWSIYLAYSRTSGLAKNTERFFISVMHDTVLYPETSYCFYHARCVRFNRIGVFSALFLIQRYYDFSALFYGICAKLRKMWIIKYISKNSGRFWEFSYSLQSLFLEHSKPMCTKTPFKISDGASVL